MKFIHNDEEFHFNFYKICNIHEIHKNLLIFYTYYNLIFYKLKLFLWTIEDWILKIIYN